MTNTSITCSSPYLPLEGLYMIHYHSFYAWHRENEYQHLCNAQDDAMKPWVQRFQPVRPLLKESNRPSLAEVKPYYGFAGQVFAGELRF